jgi:uncharacterized protein (DUF1015 family)
MSGRKLIIADGHHRYETALAYRDEQRAAGNSRAGRASRMASDDFLQYAQPGLTVLPTHRVVGGLKDFSAARFLEKASEYFDVEDV